VTLLITAVGAGFFFGLYYNFLVLVPITLAAAIMCGASAMLTGASAVSTLFAIIIPAVGLQGGYMIGLTSREFFSQVLARMNGAQSNRV
jgi:hypothetical protein